MVCFPDSTFFYRGLFSWLYFYMHNFLMTLLLTCCLFSRRYSLYTRALFLTPIFKIWTEWILILRRKQTKLSIIFEQQFQQKKMHKVVYFFSVVTVVLYCCICELVVFWYNTSPEGTYVHLTLCWSIKKIIFFNKQYFCLK